MHADPQKVIMKEAIRGCSSAEAKEFHSVIEKGSVSADFPWYKVLTHFYNPYTHKGLYFFPSAKTVGVRHFNKALGCYKKGQKKRAYYHLGVCMHLLAGLIAPAHSRVIPHMFNINDLENYLEDNVPKRFPKCKGVKINSIGKAFNNIAKISYKYPCEKTTVAISFKFLATGKKPHLSLKELKRQTKELFPVGIKYSAGLIDYFSRKVKKARV